MKLFVVLFFSLVCLKSFAVSCDCSVSVFSPMTGSYQMPPSTLKVYELEEYDSYALKNQAQCRSQCRKEYEKDMPEDRLQALLITYTEKLIQEKAVGYNCTGLTTLKFPVRVKARLGDLSLGNVSDTVQVVTYEETCF